MTRPAPSADLLAKLARWFRGSPGHAAWVAPQLGDPVPHKGRDRSGGRPGLAPMGEDLMGKGAARDGVGHDQGGPLRSHEHADRELDASAGSGAVLNGMAGMCGVVGVLGHAGDSRAVPAPGQAPRGGHTELLLARFACEDARIRGGGELPAVWSAYS
jgi:hypothetical protein